MDSPRTPDLAAERTRWNINKSKLKILLWEGLGWFGILSAVMMIVLVCIGGMAASHRIFDSDSFLIPSLFVSLAFGVFCLIKLGGRIETWHTEKIDRLYQTIPRIPISLGNPKPFSTLWYPKPKRWAENLGKFLAIAGSVAPIIGIGTCAAGWLDLVERPLALYGLIPIGSGFAIYSLGRVIEERWK